MTAARALRLLPLLVLVGLAAPASAPASDRPSVTFHPSRPRVGDVAWMHVRGSSEHATVEGSVDGRPLTFFPYGGGHAALVGVDLETKPGAHVWRVAVLEPARAAASARGQVRIERRDFPVERLTLPPKMVDLDRETEARADAEAARLRTLYRTITPDRLWRGRFTRPVGGTQPGIGFGARRLINGQHRAPHVGVDYRAPRGTPVVAANGGRVALVADHFFPGRLIALDHGLGLYTLYFHLDSVSVAEGDRVERGQVIGAVGASGRATGPHLHFAVQLGSARVDPTTLLALSVLD